MGGHLPFAFSNSSRPSTLNSHVRQTSANSSPKRDGETKIKIAPYTAADLDLQMGGGGGGGRSSRP